LKRRKKLAAFSHHKEAQQTKRRIFTVDPCKQEKEGNARKVAVR